jgi:hypothetical protein
VSYERHYQQNSIYFQVHKKVGGADETEEFVKPQFMGSKSDPSLKKLPTHLGPKIRHKNPKITRKGMSKDEQDKKNPKKNRKRQANEMAEQQQAPAEHSAPKKSKSPKLKSEKKLKKFKQEQSDEKKFNSLVQSYKSRLMAGDGKQKSKWFE